MSGVDRLQRLMFDAANVRAVHVRLEEVYREVLSRGDYPATVARLLGQGLVVAGMLSSGIKYSGRVSLQLHSATGVLRMLLADCDDRGGMRALAKLAGDKEFPAELSDDIRQLVPDGTLTLNLEPQVSGGHRWQGIVALESDTLAGSVEGYFRQSEQLPTRLHLAADAGQAAGILLQRLPGTPEDPDGWNRLCHLLDTLSPEELLATDGDTLTHRLFHEVDRTRLSDRPLAFHCPCSRERVSAALRSLGREELEALVAEQGEIQADCEFCNEHYTFDAVDVSQILTSVEPPASGHGGRLH